jgi:hypothetical protein
VACSPPTRRAGRRLPNSGIKAGRPDHGLKAGQQQAGWWPPPDERQPQCACQQTQGGSPPRAPTTLFSCWLGMVGGDLGSQADPWAHSTTGCCWGKSLCSRDAAAQLAQWHSHCKRRSAAVAAAEKGGGPTRIRWTGSLYPTSRLSGRTEVLDVGGRASLNILPPGSSAMLLDSHALSSLSRRRHLMVEVVSELGRPNEQVRLKNTGRKGARCPFTCWPAANAGKGPAA